jgi:hypothetical protein
MPPVNVALRALYLEHGWIRDGAGVTLESEREVPCLRLAPGERERFERRARERLAHDREAPPDPAGQWRRDQQARTALQNLDYLPEESR